MRSVTPNSKVVIGMRFVARCTWAASLLLVSNPGQAQPSPSPSTASAPHELLSFFEGTWTIVDPKREGGFRETCGWLAQGRRHMVCRTYWQSPTGPREGLSVISYDAASGEYHYHGFRSGGAVVNQRGRPKGAGWQFTSERGDGPGRVQTRVTIEPAAEGSFRLLEESATGDGPWTAGGQVLYKRVSP